MKKINYYCKHIQFNNFIISQYCLRYGTNKFSTFIMFMRGNGFEFIDKHFRVIISLPLDDIMQSVNKVISR